MRNFKREIKDGYEKMFIIWFVILHLANIGLTALFNHFVRYCFNPPFVVTIAISLLFWITIAGSISRALSDVFFEEE